MYYKDVTIKYPSHNIKQSMEVYINRMEKILSEIINGCGIPFKKCMICQSDYSVQFHDVSLTMLREDGIITRKIEEEIKAKLYDGHRG